MRPDILPDFHFLIVAPNLGAEWLFDAARQYWQRFEPVLLGDLRFLTLIPPQATINLTVIAMRDTIAQIGVEVSRQAPSVYLDAVVYERPEEAQAELNRRAQASQPFGVPIIIPTATRNYAGPDIPTPRMPATRAPAGFITATPTPTNTPDGSTTPIPSWTPRAVTPTQAGSAEPNRVTPIPPASVGPTLLPSATPTSDGPTPAIQPIEPTPGPITG